MGQVYHFNAEDDELLSEAEKAFDLSVRRHVLMANRREMQETSQQTRRSPQVFKTLAGFFAPAVLRNQPN